MKTTLLSLLAIGTILTACNTKTAQESAGETAADTATVAAPPVATASCYAYTANKDTITLRLTVTGAAVTGELAYKLFEKDKNTGTIQGGMKGDTLLADYTFMSEGTESVRQVAFLRGGDTFTEGYAAVRQEGSRMVFEKTGDLKFNGNMALKKVSCPE